MEKESFVKYIKQLQKIEEVQSKMIGTGICLIDYNENFFIALNQLMGELFEEYAIDLIHDLVWLKKDITIYKAKTKKVLFVINSPETLWEYIESNKT